MSATRQRPEAFFFEKFGVEASLLGRTLGQTLGPGIDYADLYFEYTIDSSVYLEEGLVKQANRSVSQGFGVRALSGEKTGYAYSDAITPEQLLEAARNARSIAATAGSSNGFALQPSAQPARDLYPLSDSLADLSVQKQVDLLGQVDQIARAFDRRITKVTALVSSRHKVILIATSDGLAVGDIQPMLRLHVSCIAEEGGNRQVGSFGGGGRVPYDFLLEADRYARFTREAARQAVVNLEAVDAPAGTMDVVLGPGWPGILLHEAVGHGLEADFNRKRTSAFANLIGQRVASPLCTVIDDGTIPLRRGSLNLDDEGIPTSRTVLIEKGILKGYLQDRHNARLMKMPLTGNGRRESYAAVPLPRMTNTFLEAGETPAEEIIRSVRYGLYAVAFGGGQVDITSGKFVFSASEAYLIEDGKVTRPVRGATLIGNGPDVLTRATMVGSDLKLDEGIGSCGKEGQTVPVGVGLPTLKVSGLTVGGTNGFA
jgi:TldD protein